MPPAKPPAEAAAQLEAPVVLLGAVEAPVTQEQSPAVPALTARRPGWGTMAPIPNPEHQFADGRSAPYRLIGPTLPDQAYASDQPRRARGEMRQAAARPAMSSKPRVRHWILPVADRRPAAQLGGE